MFRNNNPKNEKEILFQKINSELFPNGSSQIKAEALELFNSLKYKLILFEEFIGLYKYSCGLYVITKDRSDERMIDAIIRKSDNKVDFDDADKILFSIKKKVLKSNLDENNRVDNHLVDLLLDTEKELRSSTQKNLNYENETNWGLVPNNPILVDGLFTIYQYLKHLSFQYENNPVEYERKFGIEQDGFDGVIDVFELTGSVGQKKTIYISGYGIEMPAKAPIGLEFI